MSEGERDAYLAAERICRVATVGAAGRPHVTPLWFVWIPEPAGLWLYSITGSQRWADLRRRPWASAVVDSGTSYAELRGVELGGPVSVMGEVPRVGEPADELRAVEAAYAAKYLAAGLMRHDGRHAWLRLVPETLVSWDFTKLATLARPGER
jgi:Pyridoxamine 5'-phosphate oxidase